MQNTQTINRSRSARRRRTTPNPLLIGLLVAFILAGSITAYLTFRVVRDFIASQTIFGEVGIPVVDTAPTATPDPLATPGAPLVVDLTTPLQVSGPTPVPWDGASRVTILVMGMDYGDWSEERTCPCRTDTMILLTVDPLTQSAGILNIPRDMWVDIPDYGYYKINMANYWGDYSQLPGGGPGLAIETVENFLGVPINYYALIDFASFERMIDEIGGVEITVAEEIIVDPLGPHNTVTLEPGTHLLDGPTALAYARQRYTAGSDYDRADRQQEVIMAIRDRVLSLNMLPELLSKAPVLYNEVAAGVSTNMTLDQAVSLAWTVSQIPKEKIKRGKITPDMVIDGYSPDGTQQILLPIKDEIFMLRDDIFTPSGPVSPAAESGDPQQLMQAEAARVAVRNGSNSAGLAATTADFLAALGVSVTETGNADNFYYNTTIISYTGKPYTVKFLVELFGITEFNIQDGGYDPNSPVDVVVILGSDWANSNPMP